MTGRNVLDTVRATHWVEGPGRTRAVGVTGGQRPAEERGVVKQTQLLLGLRLMICTSSINIRLYRKLKADSCLNTTQFWLLSEAPVSYRPLF